MEGGKTKAVGRVNIVRGLKWCDKDFEIHPIGTEEPLEMFEQGIFCPGPVVSLRRWIF